MKLLATGYRAGARLTRVTPPAIRYGAAAWLTYRGYRLVPGRWNAARSNYAAVLGLPAQDPAVAELTRQAFESYGRMLADFFLIGDLSPEGVRDLIVADGHEHVWEALEAGHGAILALPHMGSWDVAGALAGILGMPIVAVADPMPGSLDEEVVRNRSAHGMRIIPLGRQAVREIYAALDRNGLVALLCDLPHGPGPEVRFFGLRATVPGGPASIAIRRQVPILPAYVYRLPGNRYQVHVDPPIQPPRERGKAAEQALMQEVVRRFECFIHQHPDQWYAFWPLLAEDED
ncbi:MAG: lysophospholipid acyltransferase family protein [Candidatus Dormibacteraeota bacterium]|nr:lysophospholipid acyltransferase family protein [Candidatus Dormibacteraeota bacterium]